MGKGRRSKVEAGTGSLDRARSGHLRGLEGVVWGEVDLDHEDTTRVWGLPGPHDRRLPMEEVIRRDRSYGNEH